MNQREEDLKHKALTRIFGNLSNAVQQAYNKWQNVSHIMRIAQERNEEKAGGLLHNLNHYLLGSNESKLREVLKRFNKKAGHGRVNIKFINLFYRL